MKKLLQFVLRFKLLHIAYWVYALFADWHLLHHNRPDAAHFVINFVDAINNIGFQIISVYSCIYFLLSIYFGKEKYFQFGLNSLLVILLSGLANALLQRFYVPLLMPNHISFSFLNSGIIFLAKSIDIGIITVIFIFIYLVQFYYNKEQRNKLLEKERLEAELNYLKSQINPHFLFNALNSIYVLMKEDVKQAEDTLLKFSALLRYQIYDCSHDKTTLKSELEFLKNYVALENIRNGENRLVNFIVPEIINHQIIAPFVLIPFIENAFKHISSHTNSTNKIEIVISENKNILVLDVKNSFDEVVQSTHENHIGIGLQNIKRRLELLYPKKYWLTIAKEEQLFCVNLKLELDEN